MSTTGSDQTQDVRAQAAAEERAAVLEIIERYARLLSHGHGANGAQLLQQIVDEIHARGHADRAVQP